MEIGGSSKSFESKSYALITEFDFSLSISKLQSKLKDSDSINSKESNKGIGRKTLSMLWYPSFLLFKIDNPKFILQPGNKIIYKDAQKKISNHEFGNEIFGSSAFEKENPDVRAYSGQGVCRYRILLCMCNSTFYFLSVSGQISIPSSRFFH